MEQEYSKDMEYGNYCSMDNQAFPIDCETLAALQNNIKKIAATALIAGCDKLILTGCNVVGSTRREGYVFIVSPDNPLTGEILYYKGGSKQDYCHISDTPIDVTADNVPFRGAYSVRTLSDGIAGTPILWKAFTYISEINNKALNALIKNEGNTLRSLIETEKTERKAADNTTNTTLSEKETSLNQKIQNEATYRTNADNAEVTNRNAAIKSAIDTEVANRNTAIANALKNTSVAFVQGMIIMWSGTANNIPSGWALCDGQNGRPDLRNRFVIGAGDSYNPKSYGGNETHSHSGSFTLTASDIPAHRHRFSGDDRMSNGPYTTRYGTGKNQSGSDGSAEGWNHLTDYYIYDSKGDYANLLDSKTKYYTTNAASSLPPYYALCFIIKL